MRVALHILILALWPTLSLGQTSDAVAERTPKPEIQAIPNFEGTRAVPEPASPNVPPSVARPILFVHGWCGQAFDWLTTVQNIRNQLMTANPSFYQNGQIIGAYYRGFNQGVQFYDLQSSTAISQSQIPTTARFFVIELIDPRQSGSAIFDSSNVAQIPISVKADEVSQVLSALQDIIFVQDGIIVAHSMGGLVSRAYLEGLGSPLTFSNGQYLYSPGSLPFNANLGSLITIDSPHAGVPRSLSESLFPFLLPCAASTDGGLNRSEMVPGDPVSIIEPLDYVPNASFHAAAPKAIPTTFPIHSIRSYNTFDWGGSPNSDGVVAAASQDIRLALQGQVALTPNLQSLDNFEGPIPNTAPTDCLEFGFYVLHFIQCVGVQASTSNLVLQSIVSDGLGVPLGVFQVTSPSSIISGNALTGNVVLTTGAPVHGASVQLQSDDPSVQVPSTIAIGAGISTANFAVNTSAVSAPKTVHVTASYGRASQVATINLQVPQAQAQLSGTTLTFNTQLVNLRSAGQQTVLTNSGTLPMTISSIFISGRFEQSSNCPLNLAVGASCQINIVFHPNFVGPTTGVLTITDSAPGSPHTVSLSGTGFDISLSTPRASRASRAGGTIKDARREFTIMVNTTGFNVAEPLKVVCESDACVATKSDDPSQWTISVGSERAARLRSRPEEVVLWVGTGNAGREFHVPIPQ